MADRFQEQVLVEQFRRGDDAAFDRIVERHGAEIAALANRLLGWPQDVDDVVQDVFVSAFTGLKRFQGHCRLRTWLYTITINKCRTHRRRTGRNGTLTDNELLAGTGENGETRAMTAEACARIQRAVRALPPKYREVVVLRYLEELETSEICRLLKISTNVMQVRLSRAKSQLKDSLNELMQEKS